MRRVDPAVGLLLELPAQAAGDPGTDPSPDPGPASALPPPREKGDKRRGGRKKAARAAKRAAAAAAEGGGTGLGLGLGSGGGSAPAAAGYAHISNVSDAKVDKLDKARPGSTARTSCKRPTLRSLGSQNKFIHLDSKGLDAPWQSSSILPSPTLSQLHAVVIRCCVGPFHSRNQLMPAGRCSRRARWCARAWWARGPWTAWRC